MKAGWWRSGGGNGLRRRWCGSTGLRKEGKEAREVKEKRSEGEMSVKPEMAFDVCWEVDRGAREVMESKRGIAALNMEM